MPILLSRLIIHRPSLFAFLVYHVIPQGVVVADQLPSCRWSYFEENVFDLSTDSESQSF